MTTDEPAPDEGVHGFSALVLLLRFIAVVTVPIVVSGVGLWWFVGNDRVDRAVDLRAGEHASLAASVLDARLDGGGGAPLTIAVDGLDEAIDRAFGPVHGAVALTVVTPDGSVVFSNEPVSAFASNGLSDNDRTAFRGVPTGAEPVETADRVAVDYVVPLAVDDGPTVAVARISVPDDQVVAGTIQDVRDLAYLFGGAFLGLLLALIPLCWWSLGEVRRQFRRTRTLALTDNLTGLANRTSFHERLAEAMAAGERAGNNVGLVLLDLDGFKAINDTGGHAAGDRLLKRVAKGLLDCTRRNELSARLGGDEFAVLLPRVGDREQLVAMADRLHERLDLTVEFSDGRSLRVTASIGLAMFPEDASSVDDLLNVADVGMYSVKASRKAKLPPRQPETSLLNRTPRRPDEPTPPPPAAPMPERRAAQH